MGLGGNETAVDLRCLFAGFLYHICASYISAAEPPKGMGRDGLLYWLIAGNLSPYMPILLFVPAVPFTVRDVIRDRPKSQLIVSVRACCGLLRACAGVAPFPFPSK